MRRKLKGSDDGDRQMVQVLSAVLINGLAAVEAACAAALAGGVRSADVILNILAQRRGSVPTVAILIPDAPQLRPAPIADCALYNRLPAGGVTERTAVRADDRTQTLRHGSSLR